MTSLKGPVVRFTDRPDVPMAPLDPMANPAHENQHDQGIPRKGDRIELNRARTGVRPRGIVQYADHLQILVKWDNGRSQSLRPGVDHFRIIN